MSVWPAGANFAYELFFMFIFKNQSSWPISLCEGKYISLNSLFDVSFFSRVADWAMCFEVDYLIRLIAIYRLFC